MRFLYQRVLKPVLFCFDPERVHHWFVALGGFLGLFALTRGVVSLVYGNRRADAAVVVDGIRYPTPIVLAAGFDYNGKLTQVLKSVAFGGVEVGSITALPTEGNPSPRLTRLIKSKSLLVNKGLRNDGVDRVIQRLKNTPRVPDFVIGVSIARSNAPEAVVTDGSPLYPALLADIWPEAEHQLCVFHVMQDSTSGSSLRSIVLNLDRWWQAAFSRPQTFEPSARQQPAPRTAPTIPKTKAA